jgi:hypothetical protein
MHAVVVEVAIHDPVAAREGLEQVVPAVARAPGFVAGYWVRLDEGHGTSIAVFETEEQATAARPPADGGAPGVTMTSITIGEVLASAPA